MTPEPLSPAARRITLAVSVTLFMALMDEAVLVTAMPGIARHMGVSPLALGLAVSIYMAAAVAVLPVSGWIAGRYGARRLFVLGNLAFGAASLWCGLADSYGWFICARAFQGAAAGLMTMVGRLILLRAIPRGQYVAALNLTTVPMLIGPTIGPAIGGLIVTYGQWPMIFFLNLPAVLLVALAAPRLIPPVPVEGKTPFDWIGALLSSLSLALLLAGLHGLETPDRLPQALALLLAGLLTGAAAVRHFRGHPAPLLSLAPLRWPRFRAATIAGGMLLRLPLRAQSFVLPLILQLALGLEPLRTGLLMLALTAGDLLFKPLVVPVYRRVGQHRALLWSGLFGLGAVAATLGFAEGTGEWIIVPVIAACGMARCVLFTGLSALGLSDLPAAQLGAANVLMNISQQLAGTLAVATTAIVIQLAGAGGTATLADFRRATLCLLAVGLAGLVSLARMKADSPAAGGGGS
ncbi:MFS transporter [Sphingobium jiangsuense]|uniref:EmrB/QacA subfamily drug resistance transporter n=1 Tax=Sphingobium jiangsuense TaxID=870476 RepID=A0A7W6FQV5_9SPHN|nr:MFS transporter [Sphingobium jiangsuense]MBB3927072.1 EmrB/QacA subfamily drug resistance transporter [Sphingobium jiangsuense]GLT00262.1 MFS transporter [Sphingobium jiangsuense]